MAYTFRNAWVVCLLVLGLALVCRRLPGGETAGLDARERELLAGLSSNPNDGLPRRYAVAAVVGGEAPRALATLGTLFSKELGGKGSARLPQSAYDPLCRAADAYLLLRCHRDFARGTPLRRDVAEWLFDSDAHLALFMEGISPEDDWPACYRLIETLFDHDPQGREAFRGLILALALVWDQPRPLLHNQMGPSPPKDAPDVPRLYDYFRLLYSSSRAKVAYGDLSLVVLTFVVDVPVPLDELLWVQKNVKGSQGQWEQKFYDITYDAGRIDRGQYDWPHGSYTLAAIRDHGGICVDQAYYANVTARAYGIPALLFVGAGRRGPHAWFGYLKDKNRWELDAGRFAHDKYATGHALNPQLNQPMTDHDLEYLCQRILDSAKYRDASRYARLACVLLDLGMTDQARNFADLSLEQVRAYVLPWRIHEEILRGQKRSEDLLKLWDAEANAFRKYPDMVASLRQKQAGLLRSLGRDADATKLLERQEDRLDPDRDDLARRLASDQVRQAYDGGNYALARSKLEDLLNEQQAEGQKVLPLLDVYLDLTRETEQTTEAAKFMKRYTDGMQRRSVDDPRTRGVFLELLIRAYENAGDLSNAERTRKKLDRLR